MKFKLSTRGTVALAALTAFTALTVAPASAQIMSGSKMSS